jgi:hypothetical protein
MFRSATIIRELVLSLVKVIFILKHSVKLRRYVLFGDVAACHRAECVLCAVHFANIPLARFSTSSRRPKRVGAISCVYFNVNFKPFQV